MSAPGSPPLVDTIHDALRVLVTPGRDAVVELRVLGDRRGTASGYFDNLDELARAAAAWDARGGVYVTLNPVNPALLARAPNRMVERARHTTTDGDVLRRARLLIDLDPARPAGISATADEHEQAQRRAAEVRDWLREKRGWPEPLFVDSGNGAHVIVGVDLPNDDDTRVLLERCLHALGLQFGDDTVAVDLKTANAARLCRVPGTTNRKGSSTAERPHRVSGISAGPRDLVPVSREALEALSALAPRTAALRRGVDLAQWVTKHAERLHAGPERAWNGGGRKWVLNPCPWNAEHTNGAAFIVQLASGKVAAGCLHNGCAGRGWAELRALVEPSGDGAGREPAARQGRAFALHEPEPWPEPVDGLVLMEEIVVTLTRFVVLPPGAAVAVALWIVFTHCLEAFDIAPILAVLSPVKRCGKTTLLMVIMLLVPRALPASNISPAAMFRAIEAGAPTLLIDETDTFLAGSDELRGCLNSGHTRDLAFVIRTVGEDHEPRQFSTWAAKVLALIGRLPETLEDRSIVVAMKRRAPGELVERLRRDRLRAMEPLSRRIARWAEDHRAALQDADPKVPAELHDRAADNWHPLLAIADLVGGEWPERARQAALALADPARAQEDSHGIMLLADLRDLFAKDGADQLRTGLIVAELSTLDERPWGEWNRGKPLMPRHLAKLLAPFHVRPRQIREGGQTHKGYRRKDLEDAFTRYLEPEGKHPKQVNHDEPLPDDAATKHGEAVSDERDGVSIRNGGDVSDVSVPSPDQRGGAASPMGAPEGPAKGGLNSDRFTDELRQALSESDTAPAPDAVRSRARE
jgi:putative DNA primase/helicase